MNLTLQQKEKLIEVGQKFNLCFIILHGSYAKNKPHSGSDLDIALLGNKFIESRDFFKIYDELAELFGDCRERELDLKTLHHVDPFFRYQVVKDGVLLYGNSLAYEEFKAYAFRDYIDSFDLRRLELILLKKSIGELSKKYVR